MARVKSNVHSIVEGHFIRARQHDANVERLEAEEMSVRQRKIKEAAACADEIMAAMEAAKAEGTKITYADIGRRMGWPVRDTGRARTCDKASTTLCWRRANPIITEETLSPAEWRAGGAEALRKRAGEATVRKAIHEQTDFVIKEAKKRRDTVQRIYDELGEFLGASETDDPAPEEPATSTAEPDAMSRAEAMKAANDFIRRSKERVAAFDAEERAEREADRKAEQQWREDFLRQQQERDAHNATAAGRIEGIDRDTAEVARALSTITSDLIEQLPPEQRAQLIPQLVGHLDTLQSSVEAALAVCRAAMPTESKE